MQVQSERFEEAWCGGGGGSVKIQIQLQKKTKEKKFQFMGFCVVMEKKKTSFVDST